MLKTFSVDESIYLKFARFCKENGMNMSKQVEFFMRAFGEKEPEARQEYVKKLDRIRKGRFVSARSFAERYGV